MASLLAVLALVALGGGMILLGSSPLKAYLTVRDADPTDVAAVEPGTDEVELVGTARSAGETVTAPITGTDAVIHDWEVERHSGGGSEGSNWYTVESGERRAPFVLDDGTGEILIDPEEAALNVERETWEVDDGEEPPAPIRAYLEGSDSSDDAASEVIHRRDRRFHEGRIGPGDDVYVYGPVQAGPAENAPDRAVRPYVGSEQSRSEREHGQETDGAGENGGILSGVAYGGAAESAVFTVSNTGEAGAQRELLTQAAVFVGFGVAMVAIGVGLAVL